MDGHRRRFSLTTNEENPEDHTSFFYVDRDAEIIERRRRKKQSKQPAAFRTNSAERIKQSFERLEKDLGRVRKLLKIESPPHLRQQPVVSISPPKEEDDDVNMYPGDYSPPRNVHRRPVITTSIKKGNSPRKHTTLAVISLDASPINTDHDMDQARFV